MKKYVSLDKRSKKAQKAYYSERRVTWGELNPVTKSVPSGKSYNRKKDKQKMRRVDRDTGYGPEVNSFFIAELSGQSHLENAFSVSSVTKRCSASHFRRGLNPA